MVDAGESAGPPHVAHSASESLGLCPGSPLRGRLRVPGSKSLAQRIVVCAGLAGGSTRIAGLPDGDDVRSALVLVRDCGCLLREHGPRAVTITGRPPGPHRGLAPRAPVSVGESGTLGRLATAALALCASTERTIEIQARGSLTRRRSEALFRALRDAGVEWSALDALDGWPMRITPIGPPSQLTIERVSSSQEVSALLVAMAAYPDLLSLMVRGPIPSRPYLEMTAAVLRDFRVRLAQRTTADGEEWTVQGPLIPPTDPIAIEPDASSAAVALAAACISGGELCAEGIAPESRQGDVRIVLHLERFGCRVRRGADGLWAAGPPTHGADVDLTGEPDLAPVLAAVGAWVALRSPHGAAAHDGAARHTTRLTGLGTLPGKESSRITVLAEGLVAVGATAHAGPDFLEIGPGAARATHDVVLDPRGDHRMAFAFALFGLFVEGVRVRDPHCVAKSWPSFWDDMRTLGARVAR